MSSPCLLPSADATSSGSTWCMTTKYHVRFCCPLSLLDELLPLWLQPDGPWAKGSPKLGPATRPAFRLDAK